MQDVRDVFENGHPVLCMHESKYVFRQSIYFCHLRSVLSINVSAKLAFAFSDVCSENVNGLTLSGK